MILTVKNIFYSSMFNVKTFVFGIFLLLALIRFPLHLCEASHPHLLGMLLDCAYWVPVGDTTGLYLLGTCWGYYRIVNIGLSQSLY